MDTMLSNGNGVKIKYMIKGNTRQERIDYQLDQWHKGTSIHNNVDNECCPDFSCCHPELLAPENERDQFVRMTKAGHSVMHLLGNFLGKSIDLYYEKKGKKKPNIDIIDGVDEQAN